MNESLHTVQVRLDSRGYDIQIGSGILASSAALLAGLGKLDRVVVVADELVASTHAQTVADSLTAAGSQASICLVPSGEKSKCIAEADRLWNELLALGADRKSVVVAVGGGVVGDLAGFVAATYARGIRFVQVPTTLLAHVDSSVGGKTGINLPGAKNMVGAFWQPAAVLIDTETLATLPDREYRSGLAEVVKYGVILDADFFAELEQNAAKLLQKDRAVLAKTIARCCRLKANVVEADERETSGLRAVLNYGHTFGHALEAVAGYGEFLHGEAVSIGMTCAARLARRLGRVDDQFVERQTALLAALQLPTELPKLDAAPLLAAMKSDKKTESDQIRFVLPTRLGHVELVDGVSLDDARAAMA